MFEEIKSYLDEFENALEKINKGIECNDDEIEVIEYFDLNLSKLLIQDGYINSDKVAKIIFAAKDLSNEIVVKVE